MRLTKLIAAKGSEKSLEMRQKFFKPLFFSGVVFVIIMEGKVRKILPDSEDKFMQPSYLKELYLKCQSRIKSKLKSRIN